MQKKTEDRMVAWFTAYFNNAIKAGDKAISVFKDEYYGDGATINARLIRLKDGIYAAGVVVLEQQYTSHLFPMFQKCVEPTLNELGYACKFVNNGDEILIAL
jgi:hypothetical protein